jgi:hypothetical protein
MCFFPFSGGRQKGKRNNKLSVLRLERAERVGGAYTRSRHEIEGLPWKEKGIGLRGNQHEGKNKL